MKLVICGLSITSSWGNGHATTLRALTRALHARGWDVVFFEHDVEWYASNRDLPEPSFCRVQLYGDWKSVLPKIRSEFNQADVAMVGSYFPDGIPAVREMLDSRARVKTFYDIDTPITVAKLTETGETDYLLANQISGLDVYFSFTGGPVLPQIEQKFGVRRAVPLYCSFDPERYHSYPVAKRFACDLSYMGTYAPDRQPKLEDLLCEPARQLPNSRFLVAGPQYPRSIRWPSNVRRIMHLNPRWHPHFYSSSRITLNVTRRDMVQAGYSPSVRLFEAAACGAAIASDNWPGLETFFSPGNEILLPAVPNDVVRYLTDISDSQLKDIGRAAQQRVRSDHTSDIRAVEFERAVENPSLDVAADRTRQLAAI
ncbi:MAG: glycosyltransferase [Acidobacteriaceae bacterium]